MIVCCENLYHAQELQKQAHDKGVKTQSYAPDEKVWLNSKFIKTKRNRKLEAKFFGPFRVLHLVGKQAYKLELPRNWKIHDVFYDDPYVSYNAYHISLDTILFLTHFLYDLLSYEMATSAG